VPYVNKVNTLKKGTEKKRLLVVHQFVWAHYKAKIYSELHKQLPADMDWHVLQLSVSEGTRTKIGNIDWSLHQYPVTLLYEELLEKTPFWGRFWKVMQWVRAYRPDAINLPGYYDMAMNLVSLYCKATGVKVIMANDSTEADNPNVGWREAIKRFFIQRADGFYCYGSKSAEYMIKMGAKPNQIFVANNAVDNDTIRKNYLAALPSKESVKQQQGYRPHNFIFVGRLFRVKNLFNLLAAYQQVARQDWGFLFVGSGDEQAEMEVFCQKNDLTGVHFIPGQAWYDVPALMGLGDVFVLPSYSESWGLVVNEAMVCEMPVLVSNRCGSSHDLVENGVNGFTFDPYDVDELAEKMKWFMEHSDQIPYMGHASFQKIQRFSPQQVAKEMIEGFYQVINP